MARKGVNKGRPVALERQFWELAQKNNLSVMHYRNALIELAISRFEWDDLPESVDQRFLELALMYRGHALFFEDPVLGYLALKSADGGYLNVYDIPTSRTVDASNGYQFTGDENNSVIIYDNMLHIPPIYVIDYYAERLANLDRTIDINVNAQKTPLLIVAQQEQELRMKILYMQYQGNTPVIFGDKQLTPNTIQVLKTDCPLLAPQLYELKEKLWNEAIGRLGIANISYQKKERLIRDEVLRGMGATIHARYSALTAREQACEQINKMFGLNVSVKFREQQPDGVAAGAESEGAGTGAEMEGGLIV